MTKVYFLDNFDSFSYNLVDELSLLGLDLVVYRNNISAETIFNKMSAEVDPVILVLSPGTWRAIGSRLFARVN